MFLSTSQIVGVENIAVAAGHSYTFALFDGVIAHGASLTFPGVIARARIPAPA